MPLLVSISRELEDVPWRCEVGQRAPAMAAPAARAEGANPRGVWVVPDMGWRSSNGRAVVTEAQASLCDAPGGTLTVRAP
jgi:hypothetical protein